MQRAVALHQRSMGQRQLTELYGAGQKEVDVLSEALRTVRGQRLLVLNDATIAEGLSSIFAVAARTTGGKWVAEMAIHRAAVWLDDLGMLAIVPADLTTKNGVELVSEKASKAVLFRDLPPVR